MACHEGDGAWRTYPDAVARIEAAVVDDGVDAKALRQAMRDARAVMSGSTVLNSIAPFAANESALAAADVDLYVSSARADGFLAALEALFDRSATRLRASNGSLYTPKHAMYESVLSFSKQDADAYHHEYAKIPGLLKVHNFRATKIQVRATAGQALYEYLRLRRVYQVCVVEDEPIDFVQRHDLTVVQNWFDGDTITSAHPLCVERRSATITRDMSADFVYRIAKYESRGFAVHNPHGHAIATHAPPS